MPDTPTSPLVLTKLRVPGVRPRLVPRSHLIARLAPEPGRGLTLVCAPAGYGKSTLLAEWSRSLLKQGVDIAWYALDPSDDDPHAFASYLVESLSQGFGLASELARVARLLRASPEADLQGLLPALINAVAASGRECVLVLDDYHLIGAPAIHSALAFLLGRLPENMHVAIGTRSDPPLPLARMRARGLLLEVRAADLRFSVDEAARFLNEVMQLDLSQGMVAALEERTEGWVAGLQLAALSLSGRSDRESFFNSFTGSHRYLVEYLLDEVFGLLPDSVQAFLLATSILDRLSGRLCDEILGQASGSEELLDCLVQQNLFLLPLDDQGCWYRYHHLFQDFLLARLRKTGPERERSLHRRASEWHSAHGNPHEAVRHAFLTGDWAYAAAVVEQHSFDTMMRGEVSTIYRWCIALPDEIVRARPGLGILFSWTLVLDFRRQSRAAVEERLQQAEEAAAALEDRGLASALLGSAAVVRNFLAVAPDPAADPCEQLARTQRTLDGLPEGDLLRFGPTAMRAYAHMALQEADAADEELEAASRIALGGNLFFGVAVTVADRARLAHAQGHLQRAVEICHQGRVDILGAFAAMSGAQDAAPADRELPALGCVDVALGCVHLEQDRVAEAEAELLGGLELIGHGMNPYYEMVACVALARLREFQGRSVEGAAYLARLEEAWPDIAFCTGALRIMRTLRAAPEDQAILPNAAAFCASFAPPAEGGALLPGLGPFGACEAYYLTYQAWARAQIALGNPQAARRYLQGQVTLAEAHGLAGRATELWLLDALAADAEGDPAGSREAIERALIAAEPGGHLRIFDQEPALTRLLIEAKGHGIRPDYLGQILGVVAPRAPEGEAIPSGASRHCAPAASPETGEELSERELEVLRLVARGASNQEIAGRLVISVGTVKSHVNHILGKLDAHNRTEAVARARRLGWLDE